VFYYHSGELLPVATSGSVPDEPLRVRAEFPETWLWSESSTGYHLMPALVLVLVNWAHHFSLRLKFQTKLCFKTQ